jgi:NADH:ubiquinone oxidoreductase subunit 2 (subunit N)
MKKIAYIGSLLALPLLSFAAIGSIQDLGSTIINIINQVLVPIVFALAFIVFIWGVFLYFIQGGHDEEKRETGRTLMLYGIIGFFLMVSVWGLVNILLGTFQFGNNTGPTTGFPQAPTR